MKPTRWIIISLTGLAVVLTSSAFLITSKTFRTTGLFYTFTQGHDAATILAGHNLANLAAGRSATSTAQPNQVLALTFLCDFSATNLVAAKLVVYDQTTSSIVADIADTVSFDTVTQRYGITNNLTMQGSSRTNWPNLVRFLGQFQINNTGNATNGLIGGYLTVAGRIHADLTNGSPVAVKLKLDSTTQDRAFGDQDVPHSADPDTEKLSTRTGLAHCVGVIDAVQNGVTNTILIPFGHLSIRGEQP